MISITITKDDHGQITIDDGSGAKPVASIDEALALIQQLIGNSNGMQSGMSGMQEEAAFQEGFQKTAPKPY